MKILTKFHFHFYRKATPEENTLLHLPLAVPSASTLDSPPPTKRNLSQPPPLTRNRKFRKTRPSHSDSDSDTDPRHITPPQPIDNNNEIETKSYNLRSLANDANATKTLPQQSIQSHCKLRTLRKRNGDKASEAIVKQEVPLPMKRLRKAKSVVNLSNAIGKDRAIEGSEKYPSTSANNNNKQPYTDLKYLESIGSIVRIIQRAKHPYINRVPTAKNHVTPLVSHESQTSWQRKTRLKISYRVSTLHPDDVQFALIVYEPLTHVTRRNLLLEFQKVAQEEEDEGGEEDEEHEYEREIEVLHRQQDIEELQQQVETDALQQQPQEVKQSEEPQELHELHLHPQEDTKESPQKPCGTPLRASSNISVALSTTKKSTSLIKAKNTKTNSLRRLRF